MSKDIPAQFETDAKKIAFLEERIDSIIENFNKNKQRLTTAKTNKFKQNLESKMKMDLQTIKLSLLKGMPSASYEGDIVVRPLPPERIEKYRQVLSGMVTGSPEPVQEQIKNMLQSISPKRVDTPLEGIGRNFTSAINEANSIAQLADAVERYAPPIVTPEGIHVDSKGIPLKDVIVERIRAAQGDLELMQRINKVNNNSPESMNTTIYLDLNFLSAMPQVRDKFVSLVKKAYEQRLKDDEAKLIEGIAKSETSPQIEKLIQEYPHPLKIGDREISKNELIGNVREAGVRSNDERYLSNKKNDLPYGIYDIIVNAEKKRIERIEAETKEQAARVAAELQSRANAPAAKAPEPAAAPTPPAASSAATVPPAVPTRPTQPAAASAATVPPAAPTRPTQPAASVATVPPPAVPTRPAQNAELNKILSKDAQNLTQEYSNIRRNKSSMLWLAKTVTDPFTNKGKTREIQIKNISAVFNNLNENSTLEPTEKAQIAIAYLLTVKAEVKGENNYLKSAINTLCDNYIKNIKSAQGADANKPLNPQDQQKIKNELNNIVSDLGLTQSTPKVKSKNNPSSP